eukprot:2078094-Amphidinium_carterae.2
MSVERASVADSTVTRNDLLLFQQQLLETIGAQLQAGFAIFPQIQQQMASFKSRIAALESKGMHASSLPAPQVPAGLLAASIIGRVT